MRRTPNHPLSARLAGFTACILILLAGVDPALGQETSSDWAWKSILKRDGVEFLYIFYSVADNNNNGVVLKIVNWNDYPIAYRTIVIFRSASLEREEMVSGRVGARTFVTGEEEGLFFVPFKDGERIAELGLRAYRVSRLPTEDSRNERPYQFRR